MSLVTHSIEQQYSALLKQSQLSPDPEQVEIVYYLQQCLDDLHRDEQSQKKRWLMHRFSKPAKTPGIYIWGPVGRGKTMLMDLFCQSLARDKHIRLHFHRFMLMIHQQLFQHSGKPDPLAYIAHALSAKYKVICFDEFYVSDIGDAMLLGRLYQALFSNGVTIISTSNTAPDNLYADGLHRDRFLPAIKMIKNYMRVISLDNGVDHRRRALLSQQAYFIHNEKALELVYQTLTGNKPVTEKTITLSNRPVKCRAENQNTIWFNFSDLCEGARSAQDYIELATSYTDILLSNVPQFRGIEKEQIKARGTEDGGNLFNTTGLRRIIQHNSDDSARRFISLVDELYDCRVNLFLSAEVHAEQLYQGELLIAPFKRTLSRLHEMSSVEYQNSPVHTPIAQKGCSSSPRPMLSSAHDRE